MSSYYITFKKKVVYGPTEDFYACLDALKSAGPGRQMVRDDGEPIAFNPQPYTGAARQYPKKEDGPRAPQEETPHR